MNSPIAAVLPVRVVTPPEFTPVAQSAPPPVPGSAAAPAGPSRAAPAPVDAAAVAEALKRIAPPRTDLEFRVEPGAGRIVVSVIDAESGEVVRQIPSEEALRIARHLAELGNGIFEDRA